MGFVRGLVILLGLVFILPAFGLVEPSGRDSDPRWLEPPRVSQEVRPLDPAGPGAAAEAARSFLARHGGSWEFRLDPRTGRPDLIRGSGIPLIPGRGNGLGPDTLSGLPLADGEITPETLEPLAREFLESHRSLLLPARGTLSLDRTSSLVREKGRLVSLYFDWLVDGVPVEGASVFMRLNSGNITQLGAPRVGHVSLDTRPSLNSAEALKQLLAYSGDEELHELVDPPQLRIQPEDGAVGELAYRLIWRVSYRVPGRIETWEGRIDARTGEVIGFRDINRYARVVGGVYPRTVFDGNETRLPLPLVDVTAGGTPVTTDASGAYSFSGGKARSGLGGQWFNTNCQGCTNPGQPAVEAIVGTGWLDFGLGGVDEVGNGFSTPADRNAFYHLNQVRRIGQRWLPSLSWMNQNFPANVNIDNNCNAVYDGSSVNFYRSGGGCHNTGEISDVMHHEWGHGLDLNTRSGDGGTGEGTADIVAMHMSHSPEIGPGFRTTGAPVRDVDRSSLGLFSRSVADSVCGGSVHCLGQVIGQTVWELAGALVTRHGPQTGWRESERLFFTSLPDQGAQYADGSFPIYDAYINADDDDGNLTNGTPNAAEIFAAFNEHEIANSSYPASPHCLRPDQPSVTAVAQCDRFDLSWNAITGVDHYEIVRAEARLDSAFFPVATVPAGQATYQDAEVAPAVDYWYAVIAVDGSGCESTSDTPVHARLLAQPILSVSAAAGDDTPRGNRSGFADPGEEVDLRLTLSNHGEIAGAAVSGTVTSATPGVTVLEGFSTWPEIPAGGVADGLDTLRFETDDPQLGCGEVVELQFVPGEASGCATETSYFQVRLGEEVRDFDDDFETDLGWSVDTVNSTASTGAWVRGDPVATTYQPGSDVSDLGVNCWFTAQNPSGGIGTDDVDDGVTILVSPRIDLSGLAKAELAYHRWFANRDVGEDIEDFFKAEVSDDDGANWVLLELLDYRESAPAWTERRFDLEQIISLTDQVRFRFQASDGATTGNLIEAAIDEVRIGRFVCDDTPACFVEPTFAGLQTATAGASCAEIDLSWLPASSNCQNATLHYNVYRSTDPGFAPGPGNLIAAGLTSEGFTDSLLVPGQVYHYVVRAFDSRSGEDGNLARLSVAAAGLPDIKAPVFGGLEAAAAGAGCGEVSLSWSAALETCTAPVSYEIYRDTDPAFVPGPANRIGSSLSTSFVDAALAPGVTQTYVVRARDGAGNEDPNTLRLTVGAGILDQLVARTDFEPGAEGWKAVAPNDAVTGNWEWGDPEDSDYQPGDDATPGGVNCWVTGLTDTVAGGGNNDVDDGTTTLLSATYDAAGMVDPVVSYSRWFTNDRGNSPGEDPFVIEVSNDNGTNWTSLEQVGAGTPLDWVEVEIPLSGIISPTDVMRFRFTAADLGSGSMVEAAIDEFELIDRDQGCLGCPLPVQPVETILVDRSGDDVVLDWTADPAPGTRFAVHVLSGPAFAQVVLAATTEGRTFVHPGAALSGESYYYRVTAIDACGNESVLE